MRFKRYMFLTLMLFLTIFSISFVCANENLTYENAGELSSLSDLNPIDAVNENVDFIDEANDDLLAQTSGNENNDLVNNESHLLRSSNDVEKENSVEKLGAANTLDILGASNDENGLEILGAGNDLTILAATDDEPILGRDYNADDLGWNTAQQVINAINECGQSAEGGTIYLCGRTYSGGGSLTTPQNDPIITLSNVRVVGGSPQNPNQVATFSSDGVALTFTGRQIDGYYTSASGYNLVNVNFENLRSTSGRMFSFRSGSLTNVVFNNLESYEHLFFLWGCHESPEKEGTPITLTNCNFTNCKQTYSGAGDHNMDDGHGQLGVLFGAKLVDCNFINTSSANHGGAFCISDEYSGGGERVASSLTNCNFINVSSRWFAVYIHGNYTGSQFAADTIKDPQVVENCKFINCSSSAEYGGALGISHNNVIIRNSEFINNTGGEGAAIMVGGIEYLHDAFLGYNIEGNNMTIDNCIFKNNRAKTQGQSSSQTDVGLIRPTGNAGAVYVYGNNTKIFNTVFEDNSASNDGGAVFIHGWGTHFENSTLDSNSAINGTVYIEGSNTRVINSNFTNNDAINGAGIYVIGQNTYIANSEFTNNTADPNVGLGGAIDVVGDYCTLITVTCNNNTANCGGAGFIRGYRTTIRNSTFDDNSATLRGGGLDVYGDMCTVDNVEVSDNSAGTDGGAVYVVGNDATFTDVTSINNTAARGGSTFIKGDNIYVTNCTLDGNKALSNGTEGSGRGGGLDLAGTNCHVYDIDVSNNYADNEGGAIYIKSNNLDIYDIISIDNSANLGGSTFIEGDNIVLHDCAFDGNNATLRGGGLNILGENCYVYNVEVSDNTAGSEGGAVYVRGNDATFRNVTSINNTAARGGSTFIIGDNAEVHNCTLDNNQALYNGTEGSGRGGGIDIAGKECKVYDLEVSNNHADREGGAIYIKSSNLNIYEIDSLNNTAARGGSVFIEGDNITVSDSTFSNNRAIFNESIPENSGIGGAIDVLGNDCKFINVTSLNNTANRGGSVFIRGNNTSVSDSRFSNNQALFNESHPEDSGIGGAIDVLGNDCKFINVTSLNNTAYRGGSTFVRGDNTIIKDCTLDNNTATLRGGGLNVAGDNCTIENVDVSNNKAGLMGGAIYVNSTGTKLTDITANNNTAQRGGAAFINGTNITIRGGMLNNNKANFSESDPEFSGLGGAFDITGNDILIEYVHSHNNTAERGGAAFIRGDDVTVQHCNLDNNSATLRGGGINIAGDRCNITNVTVSNNKAGLMGGAIYVNSTGTNLTDIIANNNSAERGGAVFVNGTSVIVRGGVLNNNNALFNKSNPEFSGLGGAFDIVGNNILFDGITSNNNNATLGGSAFIRGSDVIVQNSNLDYNNATLRGGALDIGGGEGCQIINVSASYNHAGNKGGAVYVNGDKALFENVTSNYNTAEEGGSSYIEGDEVNVTNCNLDNNVATKNGGGLAVSGVNGNFEHLLLSNCNASDFGGAVYVIGDNNTFDNVTSIHNTANKGGSSYVDGDNTIVKNSNLDNNCANKTGGGLYVYGDNCTFENVALSNCNATEEGGAISVLGNNNVFNNVTSIHNTADNGGSSYISGNNTTIMNCNLNNNIAQIRGGGVYIDGNECKFINVSLSNCIAVTDEGGAVYSRGNFTYLDNVTSTNNTAYYGGSTSISGDNATVENSKFIDNHAEAGGAICVSGDDATFTNNDILYNDADTGGGIYITGEGSEFSDNQISYNDANMGGAIYIFGSSGVFTDNNITFNNANVSGGAVFILGNYETTYFTNNNISSNHAEMAGGGIYSEDEDLILEQIYAFNNTAQKAGFADINTASDLIVESSTFISNHALGNITEDLDYYGTSGIGGAFFISQTENAVIDGNFYNNTAENGNGSAIYVQDSKLRVHDSRFFDNLAHSYALPILPEKGTTYMVGEPINVTIWHIGGDNIANAIHNKDAQSNVTINNITYEFYNHGNRTIKTTNNTDEIPVIGFENSDDGEKIYLDDLEDNQPIYYTITKIGAGDYPDPSDITDISGSISFTLNGLPVGRYLIQANYDRTTYYTEILNQTWIRIIDVSSINVTKVWDDNDDFDHIRPSNVTVLLYNDTGLINQTVLDSSNNWTYSFEGLLIYDEDGINLINYTIEEVPIDGYATVITNITGDHSVNLTITNIHIPLTSVNVTKIWNDGDNAYNTRPDNITVVLLANDTAIDTAVLNAANNWTWSFTNLTIFNDTEKVVYTIGELTVDNYIVNITESPAGIFTIVNTLVTDINVTKIWDDGNNTSNTRPANITVELLADGVWVRNGTLNAFNDWKYTFTELPVFNGTNAINYTIREFAVPNYIVNITKVDNTTFVIVNSLVTGVNVTKIWDDGNNTGNTRPDSITVELFADGVWVRNGTLNASNDWKYTFAYLPVTNGTAVINYTIREFAVENYIVNITKVDNTTFVIVNTLVTDINVTKIWNDGNNTDNTRPDYITVELFGDGVSVGNGTLNASNDWKYTFTDLPVYNGTNLINYTISEVTVENYIVNITKGNGVFVIENTLVTSVNVTKVWNDGNNADNTRPEYITVELFGDDVSVANATLNANNNWYWSFTNLTVFNGTERIKYTIREINVTGYVTVVTNSTLYNWTITNTELVNITVVKVWNDGNNVSGKRPANVTVVLLSDGEIVRNATLDVSNNWTYTFVGFDKFKNNGTLIKYSIAEVNVGVPGYTTVITNSTAYNWTVNNTYVPKVNKTANETKVFYHDFVLYNITITNIGTGIYNETLTIIDSLPYGLDYNKTVNITGARVIQEGVYNNQSRTVTWIITDIDPNVPAIIFVLVGTYDIGNLTNNVTLIGPNGFNDTVNATVEVVPIVDVSVVKTVDNSSHFVDDIVVWTITVSNAANGTNATNVVLNDTFPPAGFILVGYNATEGTTYDMASGVWTIGDMANGTSVTLTITSVAKQNGTFTNYANVTCDEHEWNYSNNFDNATVVVVSFPINKTVSVNETYYNSNVTYNLTVSNIGNYTYTQNITVVDVLPDGIYYLRTIGVYNATVVANATQSGNNVTWVITNIDPNTTAVIEIEVWVHVLNPIDNTEIVILPNGTSMNVTVPLTVVPIVDVSVVKTVDNSSHFVDDIVVWTITVSNAANGTNATNVVLNDTFPPAGFILVGYNATEGTTYDMASGVWTIGDMANGTSVTLTITSVAKQNGTFTNYANVTCDEHEWNYSNNFDNATVVVVSFPINKTVSVNETYYNSNVTYNLTVSNIGNYTYTQNITVVDVLPDGIYYLRTIGVYNATVVANATQSGNNVTWVITNIDPNTTAVIEIEVRAHVLNTVINTEIVILPNGTNMTVSVPITVLPIVDVSVVKTVDNSTHFVDDIVVWTITVSNAANGTNATNVVLKDTFPPAGFNIVGFTASEGTTYNIGTGVWTIGDMANGTSVTLTITSIAKQNGTFTNHANVNCTEHEWNYSNNYDNATVVVFDIPDINKTVNNTTPFIYEYVLYNITITNVGNVTYIETLTVVDSLPEGLEYIDTVSITGADVVQRASVDGTGQVVTWKITNIKADVPAIITVKARANVLGNLTNNATVIGPNGTNKTVNCTIDVKPICDLEILKIVDKKVVYVNELVEWRIIVVNHGPSTAPNVVVKDNLPAGLKVIKATPSVGSFNKNTGIWSIGDVENNTSVFLVLVTQAVKEGSITNVVVVNTTINETNYTNNKASNKTVVKPICDVEITKVVNFDKVYIGENVIWTIKVKNNGPSTAKNVRVTDQLPKGLKVLDAKVTKGSFNMNTLEWTIGSLASGASATLRFTTTVNREGLITNPVSVTTTTEEYDYTNNKAKDTTRGIPIVDLTLKKYADKSVYHKGEKMHWTITVKNYGPSTATGVVVNDVLPSGVKFIRFVASKGSYDPSTGKWDIGTLAKGETATIEIYCNVTAEEGTITNFASVTCNETESNPDNNNDSATITVEKVPDTPVTPPATMHPTGNPIVMVVLSLLAMVGVTLRRKL